MALWNNWNTSGIREFELFADDDDDFTNGRGNRLGGQTFEAEQPEREGMEGAVRQIPVQTFSFESTRTQYIHLNVLNTHGSNSLVVREVAFEQVPFEISPIPGIAFILGAGGINYFLRKGKKGQK